MSAASPARQSPQLAAGQLVIIHSILLTPAARFYPKRGFAGRMSSARLYVLG
jgi:hypothetical protein